MGGNAHSRLAVWTNGRSFVCAAALLWASVSTANAEVVATNGTLELRSPLTEPLAIELRLRVATTQPEDTQNPPTSVLPLAAWKADGEDFVAEPAVQPAGLWATVRAHPQKDGSVFLTTEVSVKTPLAARLISLEFEADSGAPEIGGRDLRSRRAGKKTALSGLDPKWVVLRPGQKPWTVLADDDVDGLKLQVAQKTLVVQADLLNSETRPFVFFQKCTEHWREPNRKTSLATRELKPGETLSGHLTLYPGAAVPLLKARFPEGRRAALVVTDHADQTTVPTLYALMGGTSLPDSKNFGKGGFLGHGLLLTKALWRTSGEPAPVPTWFHARKPLLSPFQKKLHTLVVYHSQYDRFPVDSSGAGRPQLDDPAMVKLADVLHKAGIELGPHSATPQADDRKSTEEALRFFENFGARTWIDHQPYTNCEALTNRGFRAGKDSIADLLERYQYRYAWSGIDVPPSAKLNLLEPRHLSEYVPVFYPAGRLAPDGPTQLWLFSTMMTYADSGRFFALYKKKSLDELERERGLHIAHTYLEAFHPPGSKFYKRNLMVPGKTTGEVVPHPRLEQLLAQWERRVKRKTLWMPTLQQLGEHVRAMTQVTVRLSSDGAAMLTAQTAVKAASFVLPRPAVSVYVDGQPLSTVIHDKSETTFFLDLAAAQTVRVDFKNEQGQPLNLLRPTHFPTLIADAKATVPRDTMAR